MPDRGRGTATALGVPEAGDWPAGGPDSEAHSEVGLTWEGWSHLVRF